MEEKTFPGESLGLGLKPGDSHYRAYVGPPEEYDLIAAMTFNLLTTIGVRQHHTLLDVGCGSLRIGRLLIPYLNVNKYVGVDPNRWLVEEGVRLELGQSLVEIKRPTFLFSSAPESVLGSAISPFDFAVAQSIFSHSGPDLLARWIFAISHSLSERGALLATYIPGADDCSVKGWTYPECVNYTALTLESIAAKAELSFRILDWKHPRQVWALFARKSFDSSWFESKPITWNTMVENLLRIDSAPLI
jgi:cyclopropane fatty-acyl-phospholipid synthase-like methyltransferase